MLGCGDAHRQDAEIRETLALARIHNRRTKYELVADHPDGRRVLLAYSPRRSRTGIWDAITSNGRREAIVELVGTKTIDFELRASHGATMGDWKIIWSGRTQRDAYIGGELPYVEEGGGR